MSNKFYTLPEKLIEVVEKNPNKIALRIKNNTGYVSYTYQDLLDRAQAIACALLALGVQKNDRVAMVLENSPEWVFIYFGILFVGAIVVPLDPQATTEDFSCFLTDAASKIIFTSVKFVNTIAAATAVVDSVEKIIVLAGNEVDVPLMMAEKTEKAKEILFFSEFLQGTVAKKIESINAQVHDIVAILYTSGTTGKPKGVMLSHENFYSNFRGIEKLKIFDSTHNILSILPLHHSFPFMVTLLLPIFSCNQVTYISSLKREEITACMQETGVTVLVGVPQFFYLFYQAIINEINRIPFFIRILLLGVINLGYWWRQLTTINLNKFLLTKIHAPFGTALQCFVSGGARLDDNVEIFLNKVGFTVIQGYGLTETSPIVTLNPPACTKIGSVGQAILDVTIKIVDPDASGIGEVAISGPNVMRGYYQQAEETAAVIRDSWFYSGDLGYLDRYGYLFLTGRKKELIKLGAGKNISPEEVETHYLQSRYIKELCVLAVGSGEKERLVAVIVPDFEHFKATGEIDVNAIIKLELEIFAKDYPSYKWIMGFVITKEELPRTRLGKLKRHIIRDKHLEELMGARPKVRAEEELTAQDLELLASPVYQALARAMAEELQLPDPVHLTDHLGVDLGLDSLSRVELIATLEKQFKVNVPEVMIAQISTIKELVVAIEQLIAANSLQDIAPVTAVKKTLWQDVLKTDPEKSITVKIDIAPNMLANALYLLFCGGLCVVAKLLWRLKVIGRENLPRDKQHAFILCPNHVSYLDAFLLLAALPNWLRLRIFFLGYSVYFAVAIMRNLVKISRIIPIDPATKLIDAMRASGYVLRCGKVVCIFPEGGRSPDGAVQPFKKGVGILARELKMQLVPVYIDGAFAALPRGKFFPRCQQIKITFGKPCTSEQLQAKGMQLGAKDHYEAIAKGLEEEVKSLSAC